MLIRILKWVILAAAVLLVARNVPFAELLPVLKTCRLPYLLLSVAMQYAIAFMLALRWSLLFQRQELSLRKYLYFVFVGMFSNMVLPSAVATEAVKVMAFGKKYGQLQENIGIAVWCKLLGAVIQLLLGGLGFAFYSHDLSQRGVFQSWAIPGTAWVGLLLGLSALVGIFIWLNGRFRRPVWLNTLAELSGNPQLLLKTFSLTFLVQILSIMSGYCVFLSLYPQANFWQVLFSSTIIGAVLILPFSLGGLGVREYLNILLYSQIGGIPAQMVFSINMLGYVPLLVAAATGFLWMLYRRWRG